MERKRESITLTYPHDLYRRFKEDEYLPLDEKVAQVDEANEERRKALYDRKEKEGNVVEKQMLEHNLELEKLNQRGNAMMTNIRSACEQRQLDQRKREKTFEEGLFEVMHQRSVEMEEKIAKIHERWGKLKSRQNDEPSNFLKTLKILQNQILEVTKSKDDIIQTIKNESTRINASHQSVLEKQDYDLHYLMQRVNNYLNSLKQCYVAQILKLDDTITKYHQDECERLYKCRHEFSTEIIVGNDISNMLENIDKKYEAEREHRASLQIAFRELRSEYDDVTHSFRMHMEKDQENMEMELEERTATYFLNSKQFNYNFQVLDKKNCENVYQTVYEEKKKNWFKSVNTATNLKKLIKEMNSEFETKSFEIADQCEKLRDRLSKLEVKAKNASRDNELKFQNILKMNLEEAQHLLSQICDFNKIFFEDHLGIRWEPPNLQILVDSNLKSLQMGAKPHLEPLRMDDGNQKKENEGVNRKMLQRVFETICSSMGYLMDADLPEVLESCGRTPEENRLVQLDNVFSALGFKHSESLTKLFNNLQLFAHCTHCEDEKVVEIHDLEDDEAITPSNPSLSNESTEQSTFAPNVEQMEDASLELDLMRCIKDLNEIAKLKSFDRMENDPVHQLNVTYAHILSALEITVKSMEMEQLNDIARGKEGSNVPDYSVHLEQRKKQIELMWNNYRTLFSKEHIQLWSSLEHGLPDYLAQLKRRHKLHMECDGLRRQNAQLKYMLQELL